MSVTSIDSPGAEPPAPTRTPKGFWLVLALLGVVLATTVVPGLFTIDEAHYLATLAAARQGRVTMAGTDGLPPSAELSWFDPVIRRGAAARSPVAPTASPLWAPVALAFAAAGLRGLALLNIGAFLLTAWMAFQLAARLARSDAAGWWAASAFALGGYSIEYAQGVWPHSLSAALVFAGFALVLRALRRSASIPAVLAGLLVGVATGIRYQNIVIAVALFAALALLARDIRRRLALPAAFALALALPLAACSVINHARLGSWNPISKGTGYVSSTVAPRDDTLSGAVIMTWARVVNYSARPFPDNPVGAWDWLTVHPVTGAPFCRGVVKKSWLQSSPWIALGLVALVALVWRTQRRQDPSELRDAVWSAAAMAGALFGTLALSGPDRDDMMGFNQRYLLELVAPMAVFFGLAAAELPRHAGRLAVGAVLGSAVALAVIAIPFDATAHSALVLYLPILLAAAVVIPWLRQRTSGAPLGGLFAATAIAWALVLHVGTDLQSSRRSREAAAARAEIVAAAIPKQAAVLTFRGSKDFLGALFVDHDLVGMSVDYDGGKTARPLIAALRERNMPVFIWTETFPEPLLRYLLGGHLVREVVRSGDRAVLIEVR